MPHSSTEHTISDSSSSDGSGSTPNTPPSPVAVPDPYAMFVEPQIVHPQRTPATPKRTPRKTTPPKNVLGAIDENTDGVSPDLPRRNPQRLLNSMQHMKLFQLAFATSHPRPPPPKIYDDIEGPKGEKFVDVRNNTKNGRVRYAGRKKFICLVLGLVVIIVIIVVILLAVLLTRRKSDSNTTPSGPAATGNSTSQVFPAGTYAIPSYLVETRTACTSNSATWRCYPYQTYNQSGTGSYSALQWKISSNSSNPSATNAGYLISSSDPLFTYPFESQPLTLENKGTAEEAYAFSYVYNKVVLPTVALTSNGAATRCYFNNTLLTARLYTKKPSEITPTNTTTSGNSATSSWPYALDFYETIAAGTNVPNCYLYTNGADGARVNVDILSQSTATCSCGYQNYGV